MKAYVNGVNKAIITETLASVNNVLKSVLGVMIMISVLLVVGHTKSFLVVFVDVNRDTIFRVSLVFNVSLYVKFVIQRLVMSAVRMPVFQMEVANVI